MPQVPGEAPSPAADPLGWAARAAAEFLAVHSRPELDALLAGYRRAGEAAFGRGAAEACDALLAALTASAARRLDEEEARRDRARLEARAALRGIVGSFARAVLRRGEDVDALTDQALAALGRHTGADRAFVFVSQGELTSNTNEWCNQHIPAQREELQNLPSAGFDFFFEAMRDGQPLHLTDTAALGPQHAVVRAHFASTRVRSVLAVPLRRDGRTIGFLGLDNPDVEPLAAADLVTTLQSVADGVVSGRTRREHDDELRALNAQLALAATREHALLDLSTELVHAQSVDELYPMAERCLRQLFSIARLTVSKLDRTGSHVWHHVLHVDDGRPGAPPPDGEEALGVRGKVSRVSVYALAGTAVESAFHGRTPVTTRSFPPHAFVDWVRLERELGLSQFAVVPIEGPFGVVGTLDLSFDRAEPPTHEEISWAEQVGAILGAHIAIQEARQALNDQNIALEARVSARTAELAASEARFSTLFEQAPQAMLIVDLQRVVRQANQRASDLFGYGRAELAGLPIGRLVPEEQRGQGADLVARFDDPATTVESGRVVPVRRANGTTFTAEIGLVPLALGGEQAVLVGVTDVSARISAQLEIQRSLEEKEVLIKEIHHRVKNNLQVVASLLHMQLELTQGEATRELLRDSMLRVRSMALVHEHLYGVESLAKIDLPRYLRRLVEVIRAGFTGASRVELEAGPAELTIDVATPLGLVLSEILTNALKYGLRRPEISRSHEWDVRLVSSVEADRLVIVVEDSGPGLPTGAFDAPTRQTLGLRLVRSLIGQLRGDIRVGGKHGREIRLTIPLPAPQG